MWLVSFKRRKFGHRHAQRDGQVETQGEDGLLHVQERGLERVSLTAQEEAALLHPAWVLQPPELRETNACGLHLPSPAVVLS